jgi:hypothetical protein
MRPNLNLKNFNIKIIIADLKKIGEINDLRLITD